MNLDQLNYYIKNDAGLQNTIATWLGTSGLGNTFFVDSVNGSDTSCDGKTWENPLATLDAAIGKCTASNGDTIYVAPWHAETEATAATAIATLDIAGVSVIGLGRGLEMPTFTFTAADATFSITAASCKVSGLKFVSNVADTAVGVTVAATADGLEFTNNVFRDSAANKEFLVGLSVAAGTTDIKIIGNNFKTTAAAGSTNAILLLGGHTNSQIKDNVVFGKYSTGCILGSAAISLGLLVDNNKLINAEAAAALTLKTDCTGILSNNYLAGTTSIAAALVGDDAMFCFNNYVTGAVAASAIINPAVDAD